MSDSTVTASLLPARLDRLPMTRYQWWIYWLCAAGVLFGAADIFTIFSIGVNVQQTFNLSGPLLSTVIASAAPAGMLGAFVAGRLGDSYGRKAVFQYTLLMYFIGSIISGIAPNFATFMIGRLILGFGIGGELPTILALISEYSPKRARGPLLALINGMYAIGALIASNSALILISSGYGWRPLFYILAVPAVVILILRRWGLPESARWLEAKGRKEEAEKIVAHMEQNIQRLSGKELQPVPPESTVQVIQEKAPLREVFSRKLGPLTGLLSWAWWITSFAGISMPAYYVYILTNNFHYTDVQALSVLAYSVDANVIGVALALLTIEFIGRKPMLILTYLGYGLFAILVGLTITDPQMLLYTIVTLNIFIVWNFSMILSYTPEIYPTRNRASGDGVVTTVYNFSQFISPYIIGPAILLLPGSSVATLFYAEGILLVATAIPFFAAKETKRKTLEQIST
ncbi:MAG: MFS transporter [Nitrososphaerota archaeon]|nr:MFS transporter [Nitrososphaerota archaeon]